MCGKPMISWSGQISSPSASSVRGWVGAGRRAGQGKMGIGGTGALKSSNGDTP